MIPSDLPARSGAPCPPPAPERGRALVNAWWRHGEPVHLVWREPDGRVSVTSRPPEHSCFLAKASVSRVLLRALRQARNITGIEDEDPWLRLRWADRDAMQAACAADGWFAQQGVATYEADVHPVRRLLTDEVETKLARPRRVYLDIETDSRVSFSRKEEMRIVCVCLVDAETGEAQRLVLQEDTDAAEKALLLDLWAKLGAFDQVLAWNGERFDFPVIHARSAKQAVRGINPRRWLWLDHLVLFRRMNTMAAESGDEKQSYSLEAICQAVLGRGKVDFDASKTWEAWAAGGDVRAQMVEYCEHDTRLMRDLEERTGYIELFQTICDVCRLFPDDLGLNPTVQVDAFMLALGRERGVHFPTTSWRNTEESDRYRGAYVMDPTFRGIATGVHVCDFASMYPSIILSWNISPETKVGKAEEELGDGLPIYLSHLRGQVKPKGPPPIPEGHARAAITGVDFVQEPLGIMAMAVAEALRMRKHWSDLQAAAVPGSEEAKAASRRSTAYKIWANIFYGVAGSPQSRYFDRECAEAVSQNGVFLLKETIKFAETLRLKAGYGDTDSAFIGGCTDSEFRSFVKRCNEELYPKLLKDQNCSRNHVKLAYEKKFKRIVFVSAKRYVGSIEHYKGVRVPDGEMKLEVKGLEYKRGDSVRKARRMQEAAARALMLDDATPESLEVLVLEWKEQTLTGPLALEDVLQAKRLSKSLKEYEVRKKKNGEDFTEMPFIRIARLLQKRGRDVGEGAKIEFVVVDGAAKPKVCIPAEDWKGEVDRTDLWNNLVYRPTERLLDAAFPGRPWDRFFVPVVTRRKAKAVSEDQQPTKAESKRAVLKSLESTMQTALFGPAGGAARHGSGRKV